MAYQVRFLIDAIKSFEKLDTSVVRKILEKLQWLSENVAEVEHKGLRSQLAGQSKLRVGDYRVIYKVLQEERTIVVRYIDHRSKVYR